MKVRKFALWLDPFVQSIQIFRLKSTEELCLMTLKSDTKFEEKLTLGSKNDMRNLLNFKASSGKSGNLYSDVLLLPISHKVSPQKVQKSYLSRHQKKDSNFEEKLTFYLKNDLRNLVNFNMMSEKSEKLHFYGLLLLKVCNVWSEKIHRSCVVKNALWFQIWHK